MLKDKRIGCCGGSFNRDRVKGIRINLQSRQRRPVHSDVVLARGGDLLAIAECRATGRAHWRRRRTSGPYVPKTGVNF